MAHLLNLAQVTDAKDPPVWEALARASKHQQLLVLQQALDAAAEDMRIRTPTIETPSLLMLVLALGFWVESWDGLTTGFHPFVLGHHTSTVSKFLRVQVDRYAMVASGTGATSLADVEILLGPDGVTFPRNFSMARRKWLRTRLIFGTCFGIDHKASEGLREFGEDMSARETELEEYVPRDADLLPQIPALLLWHAQIR